MQFILNIINTLLDLFKVKSNVAAEQQKTQQSQANITGNLVSAHTFIADFGISLIITSCAICLFHDLVLVRVFGWSSAPMATQEVWQLVGLFFGAVIVHSGRKSAGS